MAATWQRRIWLPLSAGGPASATSWGGHNLTLRALLETVDRCQEVRRRRLRLPRALVSALIRLSDALLFVALPDPLRMFAFWCPVSGQKAERELGHVARPIEETIRDTLAWFELLKQR